MSSALSMVRGKILSLLVLQSGAKIIFGSTLKDKNRQPAEPSLQEKKKKKKSRSLNLNWTCAFDECDRCTGMEIYI